MTLERLSDLLVLLFLIQVGMSMLALSIKPGQRSVGLGGVVIAWGLATLHAVVHLGG